VLEAKDGREALEIATKHSGPIHLLLVIMSLPKMNGGELAGRLKAIRPKIRVAFMSGYSEFSRGEMGSEFPRAPVLQNHFHRLVLLESCARPWRKVRRTRRPKTIESRSHRKPGIPLPTCAGG